MSYRCVEPFATATGDVYGGGCIVSDDDPILTTHASHFARVNEPVLRTETATAAPSEHRAAPKKAPAKKAAAHIEPKPEPEKGNEEKTDA